MNFSIFISKNYRGDCKADYRLRQEANLQLAYMQLQTDFAICLDYNISSGCNSPDSHPSGLGCGPLHQLRFRRSAAHPPLQPTGLLAMWNSFHVGRLFDPARLPELWEEPKSANVACTDFGCRVFRVLLAGPVKSAWVFPRRYRPDLFWNHYRD